MTSPLTPPAGLDFSTILLKPSRSLSEATFPLVVSIHGPWTHRVSADITETMKHFPHHFLIMWFLFSVLLFSQVAPTLISQRSGMVPQPDWLNLALLCSWVSRYFLLFCNAWCKNLCVRKYFVSVYLVNYRGSTGFGQDSILSLIGQIGSQDVKDVQVPTDTFSQSRAIRQHIVWLKGLSIEGCAYRTPDGRHSWLQTFGSDWWVSRGFPVLSSDWSIPRCLQSLCSQEPCH